MARSEPLARLRQLIGRFYSLVIELTPLARVRKLIHQLDSIVITLTRPDNWTPRRFLNEYIVQDFLRALLVVHFDDVRLEEYTPSHAGRSARIDFLLRPEKIVLEIKMTREWLALEELRNQTIIDIEEYSKMTDCETLVCIVYDPHHRVSNPSGFESDLSGQRGRITVEVIVIPKR